MPALRPPKPTRPPPPPPVRPPVMPELRPYQLKPKSGKGTFIEPPVEEKELPPSNPEQIKCMKKKLDELNRKIRHSKNKNNGLIHGRSSLRRAITELKWGTRQPIEHRQGFIERERAFGGAYRSYRIDGESRMDVDTFFNCIRGDLIDLIRRELTDLNSARVQTTTWIRFIQEFEDVVEIDRVEKAFNSRMMEVHQGSNLGRTVDGMIAHMNTQIGNPALANSRFRFDEVLFLDVNFHRSNLTRGSSYLLPPDWIAKKKAIINPQNDDEDCFKWAIIVALYHVKVHPECVSNQ